MKSEHESLELIRRHIDGEASEADQKELQEQLRRDPTTRRLFARYANIDSTLGSGSIALKEPVLRAKPMRIAWLSWRPLAAAAAGIVFGMFCTSVVFGYVAQSRARSVTVLAEGFEDAEMPLDRDLPRRTEAWSGDFTRPHAGNERATPLEGSRLVTLPQTKGRRFSYAMRFVDLSTLPASEVSQNRQIEVSASFHGHELGVADLFQIRLAAFGGSLEEARAIWLSPQLDEKALLHVARTVTIPAGEGGWKKLHATMELPPGTTLLLVSLAAAVADNNVPKTPHYLDDVRIQLQTLRAAP
jgi:hypothetical protein